MTAYNRISSKPIEVHSNIYDPDYVVVVDETLLKAVDVSNGLKKDGAIVINTTKSLDEIKPLLKNYNGNIYTIDAKKISEDALACTEHDLKAFEALEKIAGIMPDDDFMKNMEESFKHKFAKKPEVIDGNMQALKIALNNIKKLQ